jgi:molybdopterin synthase catalytic subunit
MMIDVAVQSEPITANDEAPVGSGAMVRFDGRVRPDEAGEPIDALVYEAYMPMARTQMEKILSELAQTWPCISARVRHRVGVIRVGETAITVEVFSSHRAEAFALASAFMDRLKLDVPIWKLSAIPRAQ